ncbi:redoxin family protein [Peptostreptococcaceae bacterium oral taxon 113 str. W5053]|nr:redoxin family protein [Peptostreptococcaceae bacterium oral taxon 113 str. W5053]
MEKRQETAMGGKPVTLLGKKLNVGDKAPDFVALKQDLTPFTLKEVSEKIKIVSAVPSVDTGVCELQTKRFNEEASKLKDIAILSISMDLPFALGRFCAVQGIDKVMMLSDHKDASFGEAYGVLIEELRLLNRSIFVLDENNIIRYMEIVAENTNHPDYESALKAVKNLA